MVGTFWSDLVGNFFLWVWCYRFISSCFLIAFQLVRGLVRSLKSILLRQYNNKQIVCCSSQCWFCDLLLNSNFYCRPSRCKSKVA
ncbi:hypothetical protein NA56DRAFT_442186 [Hyaloscypha hepaticicola]|uniref:Uncharacterized protein n=1 Tax=Hyaloscypha hepaticicola TaxID=2082293 RepID=A0A2J6PGU8_9HELO|nr:hypothetical protein NA56DRAFT_442186 [Hyaloscypha hepaticicola]